MQGEGALGGGRRALPDERGEFGQKTKWMIVEAGGHRQGRCGLRHAAVPVEYLSPPTRPAGSAWTRERSGAGSAPAGAARPLAMIKVQLTPQTSYLHMTCIFE